MRARRLGRLVGSLLALAALAGGIFAYDVDGFTAASYDWTGYFGGASVDAPATSGLYGDL